MTSPAQLLEVKINNPKLQANDEICRPKSPIQSVVETKPLTETIAEETQSKSLEAPIILVCEDKSFDKVLEVNS